MGIRNYNHEAINDQKSIFLPMFCRLSIKDTVAPISAAEPSSPTVTCTGQVKRSRRVTAFPAAAAPHKHAAKPRKVHFSTKTLLPNPAPTAAAIPSAGRRSGSRSCRSSREMCVRDLPRRSAARSSCDGDRDCVKMVSDVSKMDPPLPVVKRVAPPGSCRDEVNIWKRRFDGVKSMQIEPIHLPGRKFPAVAAPSPTTV